MKLYGAQTRKDREDLGVRKADDGVNELVYVGYPDRPVSGKKVEELAKMAESLDGSGYKRLVVLGWDYEFNYDELLKKRRILSKIKTDVQSKTIPPEVYEYLKKAKTEEDIESFREKIKFHDKPYLSLLEPVVEKGEGTSKVILELGNYVLFDYPIEDEKDREDLRAVVKDNFSILIDYWAVDWEYDDVTFKSRWQAFRGFGKMVKVVPLKVTHDLPNGKKYNIAVRVVDIFGNDAAANVSVDLRMV